MSHDPKQVFVSMVLPSVEGAIIRRLTWHREWRDLAQTVRCLAWLFFLRLWEEKRWEPPSKIADFAVKQALSGRDLPGLFTTRTHGGDALEHPFVHGAGMGEVRDRRHHQDIDSLETEESWKLFLGWLRKAKGRQWVKMAKAFVKGIDTATACEQWDFTPSRLSQCRREIAELWMAWCRR